MRDFLFSEEVLNRKRLSTKNATAARSIKILVENIETGEKFEYKSLTEAGKALNVSKSAVSQALLNNRLLNKIYSIKKKS